MPHSHCDSLSPDDYILIEEEHQQLDQYLNDLLETCCNINNQLNCSACGREKLSSCSGRFPSFIYRLTETTSKHYNHEEAIMLNRPHVTEKYTYFKAHRQAHTDLIKHLKVIAEKCDVLDQQGKTAEAYRQLYQEIAILFKEHDQHFDDPFIASTLPTQI